MEKQFTTEHYNHIKKKGFNPPICQECQEIDGILNKMATYGDVAQDLYTVLERAVNDPYYVLSGDWYTPAKQALAKADRGK